MSLLKDFEKKLENLVEGFFIKQFKSRIQPVEIAKKIAREMNERKTISVSRVYAPNSFTVYLSPEDKKMFTSFEGALATELSEFIVANAEKEVFALPGAPQIKMEAKGNLSLGEIEIESSLVEDIPTDKDLLTFQEKGQVDPILKDTALIVLEKNGEHIFPFAKKIMTIGRLESNDISIKDSGVSRVHAEIRADENGFFLKDLGSTNGTLLNGKRIIESELEDGDVIVVGATTIKFLGRKDA